MTWLLRFVLMVGYVVLVVALIAAVAWEPGPCYADICYAVKTPPMVIH